MRLLHQELEIYLQNIVVSRVIEYKKDYFIVTRDPRYSHQENDIMVFNRRIKTVIGTISNNLSNVG